MSTEDQLKFALSCFRNCSPGAIDWQAVAKECDIVTTGAAQKRWSRLNKVYDFQATGDGGPGNGADPSTPKQKEKGKGTGKTGGRTRATPAKKRKIVEQDDEDQEDEMIAKGGDLPENAEEAEPCIKSEA